MFPSFIISHFLHDSLDVFFLCVCSVLHQRCSVSLLCPGTVCGCVRAVVIFSLPLLFTVAQGLPPQHQKKKKKKKRLDFSGLKRGALGAEIRMQGVPVGAEFRQVRPWGQARQRERGPHGGAGAAEPGQVSQSIGCGGVQAQQGAGWVTAPPSARGGEGVIALPTSSRHELCMRWPATCPSHGACLQDWKPSGTISFPGATKDLPCRLRASPPRRLPRFRTFLLAEASRRAGRVGASRSSSSESHGNARPPVLSCGRPLPQLRPTCDRGAMEVQVFTLPRGEPN